MKKATQAREENKLGEELEQIKLCVINAMSQGLDGKVSESDLRTSLNGIVSQSEIEKVTGIGPWIIQGYSGREYEITNGGLVNAIDTMDKAIINAISVEERSKVPIVIINGDNIEEIKTCTIANTSIATVAKDADGIWKITGGSISGDELQLTTTMTIEGKSGNKIENISVTLLKVTTAKDVIPVPTNNTTCAYVKYAMNGQTEDTAELCRVLYNDDERGLQIITSNSVADNVILGKDDNIGGAIGTTNLEKAQNSYNNAIENLNKKAETYINEGDNTVLDARCAGSVSRILNGAFSNKNDEELFTNSNNYNYLDTYVEQGYKGTDTHYGTDLKTDFQQMELLSIRNINSDYWLASREVYTESNVSEFYVRFLKSNGLLYHSNLWYQPRYGGATVGSSEGKAFRPVFLINPTAKIKSGSGTSTDPYILEVGE